MSLLVVDQDWETDESPLTLALTMARSATNAIDGTDLRGGDGTAKDGTWRYAPKIFQRPSDGSRVGLRTYARFKFKRVSGPTGGLCNVFNQQHPSGNIAVAIASGATVLSLLGTSGATSLTAGTAYWIDVDLRSEAKRGVASTLWARVYLNGALEIEVRGNAIGSGNQWDGDVQGIGGGVSASAKCSWEAVWGRMKYWLARDPIGGS